MLHYFKALIQHAKHRQKPLNRLDATYKNTLIKFDSQSLKRIHNYDKERNGRIN